ncbi:glycosyltransferase family 4 protein [Aeromonas rivipollensis]
MKILVNLLSFSEDRLYGVGIYFRDIFIYNLSEIVRELNCDITFLHSDSINISKVFNMDLEKNIGKIEFVSIENINNKFSRVFTEQFKLYSLLKKFDYIYSPNNINPIILPRGVKSIITIHDLLPFRAKNRYSSLQNIYLKFSTWVCAKFAYKIVTVSNTSKDDIVSILGVNESKVRITYNTVRQFDSNVIFHPRTTNKYFFSISALQEDKQIDISIKAFSMFINSGYDNYHFYIAGGDQGYKKELQKIARELNIENKVHFLGYIEENDKWAYIKYATALILLGKNEGFGIPVIEGMMMKRPVIVANLGALPEIVGKSGYITPPTVDGVAQAMIYSVENEVPTETYEMEIARFSPKIQFNTFISLFR